MECICKRGSLHCRIEKACILFDELSPRFPLFDLVEAALKSAIDAKQYNVREIKIVDHLKHLL